jgi:hypothetical protein
VLFYAQKSAKTTWISKSNRSLERVQKQKTGSDFPLNRFSVCVNVFLWAKMHPKFFEMHPLSRQRETGVPAMIFARYAGLF